MIYLDHNATTPLAPEVARAMAECNEQLVGNPASQHAAGRAARRMLEDAREGIAAILGIDLTSRTSDQLIFTSGGTEANNLALFGMTDAQSESHDRSGFIISRIEHPSVMGAADELSRRGCQVSKLPINRHGVVDVAGLSTLMTPHTRLVSVMLANNETGVLQPIEPLAAICQAAGVPLHTDAAQVVGKLPVHFCQLGVSLMTIAAHKFHGPPGIGALAIRHGLKIHPQLHGGVQQSGLRSGTENVALAVGMHRALQLWQSEATARIERMTRLRDRFESQLKHGYPDLVINGADAARLPHTSNVAFIGLDRQALFMALDIAGIACSTGSACASGSSEPSPVLKAMSCPKEIVDSSLRFSLGSATSEAAIDEAARRILQACQRLSWSTQNRTAAAR
jgi:cysteine desulfurase